MGNAFEIEIGIEIDHEASGNRFDPDPERNISICAVSRWPLAVSLNLLSDFHQFDVHPLS
jgi:hypothetical protein